MSSSNARFASTGGLVVRGRAFWGLSKKVACGNGCARCCFTAGFSQSGNGRLLPKIRATVLILVAKHLPFLILRAQLKSFFKNAPDLMAALIFVGVAYVFFVAALGISKFMFTSFHADVAQSTAGSSEADDVNFEKP
jgi:hypothetical protein